MNHDTPSRNSLTCEQKYALARHLDANWSDAESNCREKVAVKFTKELGFAITGPNLVTAAKSLGRKWPGRSGSPTGVGGLREELVAAIDRVNDRCRDLDVRLTWLEHQLEVPHSQATGGLTSEVVAVNTNPNGASL